MATPAQTETAVWTARFRRFLRLQLATNSIYDFQIGSRNNSDAAKRAVQTAEGSFLSDSPDGSIIDERLDRALDISRTTLAGAQGTMADFVRKTFPDLFGNPEQGSPAA